MWRLRFGILVGYLKGIFMYGLKCRSAAAAFMMGEEFHKFGRCRPDRNDFSAMALGGISSSSSRQIYLTFPADSTFKEEDVSNYFRYVVLIVEWILEIVKWNENLTVTCLL